VAGEKREEVSHGVVLAQKEEAVHDLPLQPLRLFEAIAAPHVLHCKKFGKCKKRKGRKELRRQRTKRDSKSSVAGKETFEVPHEPVPHARVGRKR